MLLLFYGVFLFTCVVAFFCELFLVSSVLWIKGVTELEPSKYLSKAFFSSNASKLTFDTLVPDFCFSDLANVSVKFNQSGFVYFQISDFNNSFASTSLFCRQHVNKKI